MKYSSIPIFAFLLILIFSCNEKNPIVLQVNNQEIRKNEFQTIADKEKNDYEIKNKKKFNKETFETWLDQYINNLILDDIVNKYNYKKAPKVLAKYKTIIKYIIADEYGPVYKEIIERNITVNPNDVALGIRKKLSQYSFEIIEFDSFQTIQSICNISSINDSIINYESIKKQAIKNGFTCNTINQRWPFFDFIGAMHHLSHMAINDVKIIKTFNTPYLPKYYLIKLINISKNQTYQSLTTEEIGHALYMYKSKQMFHETLSQYYKLSNYSIDEDLIKKINKNIRYINNSAFIDTASIQTIQNDTILKFQYLDSLIYYSVRDLIDFHNNIPFVVKFKSELDIKEYMLDIISFEYMWHKAKSINLFKQDDFIYKSQRLFSKIARNLFIKDHIIPNILIDEKVIKKLYHSNIKEYTFPEIITYDLLYFKDYNSAHLSFSKLQGGDYLIDYLYNNEKLTGFIESEKNIQFKTDSLKKGIINRPYKELITHDYSSVFPKNGYFAFAIKTNSQGTYIQSYDSIRPTLELTLHENAVKQQIDSIILRNKNIIINNIKYTDYF